MLTSNINFKNFKTKKKNHNLQKNLRLLLKKKILLLIL